MVKGVGFGIRVVPPALIVSACFTFREVDSPLTKLLASVNRFDSLASRDLFVLSRKRQGKGTTGRPKHQKSSELAELSLQVA